MTNLLSSSNWIGLEWTPYGLKIAVAHQRRRSAQLVQLRTLFFSPYLNLKSLDVGRPVLVTALESQAILLRSITMPLTKEKDIEAALSFQAEPLLPYPVEQALLAKQVLSRQAESTQLILLAARCEDMESHLTQWGKWQIEPEQVSGVPVALSQFGKAYISNEKAFVLIHIQYQTLVGVLIRKGQLLTAFTHTEGVNILNSEKNTCPLEQLDFTNFPQDLSHLQESMNRLQIGIARLTYALAKELKNETLEGMVVTGEGVSWLGFVPAVTAGLPFPLLSCGDENQPFNDEKMRSYALPIGLALNAAPNKENHIDFRQGDFAYPWPLKRLMRPMLTYVMLIGLLCTSLYFLGRDYLNYEQIQLKQSYVDLLAQMNKSFNQFEEAFLAKDGHSKLDLNAADQLALLSSREIQERLAVLQKEIQAAPNLIPLMPHAPRVSDVLAWLSQHPAIFYRDAEGTMQTRLQLENFSYVMIKRPIQGKKLEKYQIKIELDFSTSTPKYAREFHDVLITPNDWVDPKAEVKWTSSHDKYKTSFYLKDKTVYPSS